MPASFSRFATSDALPMMTQPGSLAFFGGIAAKAKEKGIESVAFDRAGYRYHGRVKALADAARAGGLKF